MNNSLLCLLQLTSPALPVGAYSYSEGLENLVENDIIDNSNSLKKWLTQELCYGSIRLETAMMLRAYQSISRNDLEALAAWNAWLSAARETEELRQQSWQMGQSLRKLLLELQPELASFAAAIGSPCNYAIAFALAAIAFGIEPKLAVGGYLHSWTSNLITAGVKLVPLGQTEGQKLLFSLHSIIQQVREEVLVLKDEELDSCSWGLSLASMAHQTQYTRLFRS